MKEVSVSLRNTAEILAGRGLEPRGRVQKYIDSEVLRLSTPYVPILSGALRRSGPASTELGSGVVNYRTPYARYQYYGVTMTGPRYGPKTPTDTPLRYHGGGRLWFERMKADHGRAILAGAARLSGGAPE